MIAEDFFRIINNPEDLIHQLVEWGIIQNPSDMRCYSCEGQCNMRIRDRKTYPSISMRCKLCKKEFSLFRNTFFAFEEGQKSALKLPPQKILKIIEYYFEDKTYKKICTLADIKSAKTITDWCNFVRERIHHHLEDQTLGGNGKIVEIDESLMRGRQKYNRGRYLLGDILDLKPANNCRRNNYGERKDGPWVFGMAERNTRNLKMFYVEDRKASTLVPLLRKHVDPQSVIWPDE